MQLVDFSVCVFT